MKKYNSQAFTPEEVEQGLLQDLLNYLLDHNKKNNNQYYDIHITSDGHCTIVEWIDVEYNSCCEESKFVFLQPDEYIMKEVEFPDNHYEMCYPDEVEDKLDEWKKEHPEWVKTSYGTWTNIEENRYFAININAKEWFKKEESDDDSTFKIKKIPFTKSIESIIIEEVPLDVLRRTEYIVLSSDILEKMGYEIIPEGVVKYSSIHINIENKASWDQYKISKDISVYGNGSIKAKGSILFLTDNHYLIYKLEKMVNEEEMING